LPGEGRSSFGREVDERFTADVDHHPSNSAADERPLPSARFVAAGLLGHIAARGGSAVVAPPWNAPVVSATTDLPATAPVSLITGTEELLIESAVTDVVGTARALDADADVRRVGGSDLDAALFAELTNPSLFGETTVLVIDGAHELPAEMVPTVAAYIAQPTPHVVLVLVHGQANRAKAVLEACRKSHAPEANFPKITRASERVDFVRAEARAAGRSLDDVAARALVDAVGSDLRELAAACAQLMADTDGAITSEVVARYYEGRPEVTSFQVADLAMEGRTGEALRQLRYALGAGVAPVLVTSALAQALRSIGRVASAPRGTKSADLARDLAMPPWKVDVVRRQMRGWTPDGLADAIRAVADADGAVKGVGGASDAGYALERVLVTIGRARGE
jgi:DNA polymerase III subunit delta